MQKIRYKNVLILGLLIALIISINKCSSNKKLIASQHTILLDTTNHFKNELGTITATKQVLELEKKDLNELLYSKDTTLNVLRKEFSKVKTIIQTQTITKINTVSVPFEVYVPYEFERKGKYQKEWFQFDYTVNQSGLSFTDFTIPNKQISITGFKRKWLLGKQTYVTDITNTNPYINNVEVQTVQVVVPKRFYDTRLFNIGVGFLGGRLVTR